MIFNSLDEVVGQVIRETGPYVKVLSKPRYEDNKWIAVAQVDELLALVELKINEVILE